MFLHFSFSVSFVHLSVALSHLFIHALFSLLPPTFHYTLLLLPPSISCANPSISTALRLFVPWLLSLCPHASHSNLSLYPYPPAAGHDHLSGIKRKYDNGIGTCSQPS